MKTNIRLFKSLTVLFMLLLFCLFSLPVWGCSTDIPPVANLDISPDPGKVRQPVTLDGSGSYTVSGAQMDFITEYRWDFDNDGIYDYYETYEYHPDGAYDKKTTYAYTTLGEHTVKLRVKNWYGKTDTDECTAFIEMDPDIIYTYDEVGNRISMTDPCGTTSYVYDYLGRLTSVTNPDNKTISYQYDASGNRTQLTDPDGGTTTYTYDDNSRLTEVIAPAGTTTYEYDSLGRQTRADYPNGTYTQFTYHPQRSWLVSLTNKDSTGSVISSYTYTCDDAGNRLSVAENDGSAVSYSYDALYQLTGETRTGTNAYSITYQYDDAGNRTQMVKDSVTTSYTYNANNQLSTEIAGGITVTYAYDYNGNLTSKTDGSDTTTYTWDWNNHLLSVSEPSGTTTHDYNGDGARISKTQGGTKTKYINDVGLGLVQVLMETDDSGATQATYTYGNDLISMNRSGVNSYYNYDGLGTVRELTDDSETVVASYIYDSFGNLIAQTVGGGMAYNENEPVNKAGMIFLASVGLGLGVITIRSRRDGLFILLCISLLITEPLSISAAIEPTETNNSYGFTGESQLNEADRLVFLRARYYDSSTGRFISRDPILEPIQIGSYAGWLLPYLNLTYKPQTLHPYMYVQNNSVNLVDPSGQLSEDFKKCWTDCADPLTGGLMGRICGSGLSLGALAAKIAGATTISEIIAIVPVWMAGIAVGCAIGCGLFG